MITDTFLLPFIHCPFLLNKLLYFALFFVMIIIFINIIYNCYVNTIKIIKNILHKINDNF